MHTNIQHWEIIALVVFFVPLFVIGCYTWSWYFSSPQEEDEETGAGGLDTQNEYNQDESKNYSGFFNILKYPYFKWADRFFHLTFAIQLVDNFEFYSEKRGPAYSGCSGTGNTFWILISTSVLYHIILAYHQYEQGCFTNPLRDSAIKGMPTYALWNRFRWQAVFESFPFFIGAVYFLAETLSPDDKNTCPISLEDGHWAYPCIVFSGISILSISYHEDCYLVPRKSYETKECKIERLSDYTINQESTDGMLTVTETKSDGGAGPREEDIIIQLGKVNFANIEADERIMLWAENRNCLMETWPLDVTYNREIRNSSEKNLKKLIIILWRMCQISCCTLWRVYYIKAESASGAAIWFFIFAGISFGCHYVHGIQAQTVKSWYDFVPRWDVSFYGFVNTLLIDIRFVPYFRQISDRRNFCEIRAVGCLPNFILFLEFLFLFVYKYAMEEDDRDMRVVGIIVALFLITITGLIYIMFNMEVDKYVHVRTKNLARLLKSGMYDLVEYVIHVETIPVKDMGTNGLTKVLLMLRENKPRNFEKIRESLYPGRRGEKKWEDDTKKLLSLELCIRLFEALELGKGKHCPKIKAPDLKKNMQDYAVEVDLEDAQKFVNVVHEWKHRQVTRHSLSKNDPETYRPLHSLLALVWYTDETSNDVMNPEQLHPLSRKTLGDTVRRPPSIDLTSFISSPQFDNKIDREVPEVTSIQSGERNEVSLDVLCEYILSGERNRFFDDLDRVIYHSEVEARTRVDSDLSNALRDYRREKVFQLYKRSQDTIEALQEKVASEPFSESKVQQLHFLKTVRCLRPFSNSELATIDELMTLETKDENDEVANVNERIYLIKKGKVRMQDEGNKITLQEGDWFGERMRPWKGKRKFHIASSDETKSQVYNAGDLGDTELLYIEAKAYDRICNIAKKQNPHFVDYMSRDCPCYKSLKKNAQKDINDVVHDNDRDFKRLNSQSITRNMPRSGEYLDILDILEKIPEFSGFFKKELEVLAKFCMHEKITGVRSSQVADCVDLENKFLFIFEDGCANIARNGHAINVVSPWSAINLEHIRHKSMFSGLIANLPKYTVRAIGDVNLMIIHSEMFKILLKCKNIFQHFIDDRECFMQDLIEWNKYLNDRGFIAAGAFGTVKMMQDKNSESYKVMKMTSKGFAVQKRIVQYVLQEQYSMKIVNSPFVIGLEGSIQDSEYTYLILKYCPGKTLKHLMRKEYITNEKESLQNSKHSIYYLPESKAKFYVGCMILGLEALHLRGIVHRDIKADNMLIDENGYLLLTDLGFAKAIGSRKTSTVCGSKPYMSPQLIREQQYAYGVDFWAMGVAMCDILFHAMPFENAKVLKRKKTATPTLPKSLTKNVRNLLWNLFEYEEDERAGHSKQGGFLQLKHHPWFLEDDSFSWEKLESRTMKSPWQPPEEIEPPSNQIKKRAPSQPYNPRTDIVDPFHDYYGFNYNGGKITWESNMPADSGISHLQSRDSIDSSPSTSVHDRKKESTFPPRFSKETGRQTRFAFELGNAQNLECQKLCTEHSGNKFSQRGIRV